MQCAWEVKPLNTNNKDTVTQTPKVHLQHTAHSHSARISHIPHPYCWHYVFFFNAVCVCVCLLLMEIAAPVSTVCIPAYMERKNKKMQFTFPPLRTLTFHLHLVFTESFSYCPLLTVITCDYLHCAPKSRTVRTNWEWSRLMDLGMITMRPMCCTTFKKKEKDRQGRRQLAYT